MRKNWNIEFMVGSFVAVAFLSLCFTIMRVSGLDDLYHGKNGYEIHAIFQDVGGLKPKARVSVAGVTIGRVQSIGLMPDSFLAKVTVKVDALYRKIPKDTVASIYTAGLLGENYIGFDLGQSEDFLAPGDCILDTNSAMVLERLVEKFVFQSGSSKQTQDKKGAAS